MKSFITSGQEAIQTSRIENVFQNDISYFSTKSFVVGTQKNRQNVPNTFVK